MKDRLDTQRAKARAMMPEMATGRSNLGREMSAAAPAKETVRQTSKRPMPAPSPISKAAPDRYQRPGPMTTERVAAYAQGGKVARGAMKKIGDDIGERAMREGESVRDYNERQYQAERAGRVPKWIEEGRDDYEMETGRKPRGQAYKAGGKVKARLAESRGMERKKANARVAESRGMERAEMRKDMAQDKRMIANAVHKHEGHLHKGEPKTKFYKDGGKVKRDEREVIEFSGPELDELENSSRDYANRLYYDEGKSARESGERGSQSAAGGAYIKQKIKGKSDAAASDAAKVFRERAYARGGKACAPRNKVARYAMGGAAKVRQGHGQKVGKMPKGGNPVY